MKMKYFFLLFALCCPSLWAQTPTPCKIAVDATGAITLACTPAITPPWSADLSVSPVFPPPPIIVTRNDDYCGKDGTLGKDNSADLPQHFFCTDMAKTPAPGKKVTVAAGADVSAAFTNASCGDTLLLAAGANFPAPKKWSHTKCTDDKWLIVRTSASDAQLPTEGHLLTPCYAGVGSLPGYPDFGCGAVPTKVTANIVQTPQQGAPDFSGLSHVRFIGVEFSRSGSGIVYALLPLRGSDHIIFDRSYIHGDGVNETNRGAALNNTKYMAFIDSTIVDFMCASAKGTCTDAQAISGGNSTGTQGDTGVFKVDGNFMAGAAETFLLGGGCSSCPSNQIMDEDFEVRYNTFYKPQTWNPNSPTYNGGIKLAGITGGWAPVVKNLFELKTGRRGLVEFNKLVNNWSGYSQNGSCFLLTTRNDPGGSVDNITIRYNHCVNVGPAFQLSGTTLVGFNWSVHDNLIENAGYSGCGAGCGRYMTQIGGQNAANPMHSIYVQNNTIVPAASAIINGALNYGGTAAPNQISDVHYDNNVAPSGGFGVWPTGSGSCPAGADVVTKLNNCWKVYTFTTNVLFGISSAKAGWPAGNFMDSPDVTGVGFVNYNGGTGGDYHLAPTSKYKGKGASGRDPGADIDKMLSKIPQ